MGAGAIAALAIVAIVGPLAGRASAHATLIDTTPVADELLDGAPEQVVLTFDEPVEVVTGGIRVIDPDGDRADRGTVDRRAGGAVLAVPVDAEPRGTYTVAWRVISEDGHNLAGTFVFHVGARTGAAVLDDGSSTVVDAAGGFGRWLAFAGMLAAGGAVFVTLLAGRDDDAVAVRLSRLAVGGGIAGAVGVVIVLVAQAATASGRGLLDALDLAPEVALDTRTGTLTALRGAFLLAAAATAAARTVWRTSPWVTGVAVAVAGAATSLAGHAWTTDQRALAVAADGLHLLGAGLWIGGVAALLLVIGHTSDRVVLGRRFSSAALVAAAGVGLSGSVSAVLQTGSLDAVTSTGYGQLAIAKVMGFAFLLVLGWINRYRLVPALERSAAPLISSLRGEVLVAVAVLGVTAALVNTPPGRDQLARPVDATATADDSTLQVTVDPARAGSNDIHLYFFDAAGTTPLAVDAVEATVATGDLPPRRLDITPVTASHVSAYGTVLASPGQWTLQVTAVRVGVPTTYTIEVQIR
jgi:copper transport protein